MTIVLQQGEKLETTHSITCKPYGHGMLHVTSRALIIEVKKKGILLHLWHNQISCIEAKGRQTVVVRWPEKRLMQFFEFRVWGAKNIVKDILQRHRYENNFAAEGVSHVPYTDAQRKNIAKKRTEWGSQQLRRAEKRLGKLTDNGDGSRKWFYIWHKGREDAGAGASDDDDEFFDDVDASLESLGQTGDCFDGNAGDGGSTCDDQIALAKRDVMMWRQFLKDAPHVAACRSLQVPKANTDNSSLEDHLCWNDAWYDRVSRRWCTFTRLWGFKSDGSTFFGAPPKGAKYDEDTGAWSFLEDAVRMFQGQPYVITTYEIDDEDDDDGKNKKQNGNDAYGNDNDNEDDDDDIDDCLPLPPAPYWKSFVESGNRNKHSVKALPIFLHTLTDELNTDAILYKKHRPVQRYMADIPHGDVGSHKSVYFPRLYADMKPAASTPRCFNNAPIYKTDALYLFRRGLLDSRDYEIIKNEFGITKPPTLEQVMDLLGDDLLKWGE